MTLFAILQVPTLTSPINPCVIDHLSNLSRSLLLSRSLHFCHVMSSDASGKHEADFSLEILPRKGKS